MISRISAAAVSATLLFSSASMAQQASTGPYVSVAAGQSIFWDTERNIGNDIEYEFFSLFLSGALGYRVTPNLRAEAELLYESADIEDTFGFADIEVFRGTISGYFDFNPINMGGYPLSPYVGGGFGFANVDLVDDDTELTWHAEGGVSVPIANNLEIVPGLRFEYITIDQNNIEDDSIWVTQVRVGVRYSF
ncbi:MAG: porin family protein [Geminicoccaceae bacterium]